MCVTNPINIFLCNHQMTSLLEFFCLTKDCHKNFWNPLSMGIRDMSHDFAFFFHLTEHDELSSERVARPNYACIRCLTCAAKGQRLL